MDHNILPRVQKQSNSECTRFPILLLFKPPLILQLQGREMHKQTIDIPFRLLHTEKLIKELHPLLHGKCQRGKG